MYGWLSVLAVQTLVPGGRVAIHVEELFRQQKESLQLELLVGRKGMQKKISLPEVHRPGLSLAGYLKHHAKKRILVFGRVEIEYLRDLDSQTRIERLQSLLKGPCPAVFLARRYPPPRELKQVCEDLAIPLFRSSLPTMDLISKLTMLLNEQFSPIVSCHGTLVEVFGVGVLIQGDSSVGKSEAALGLIEKGHRLVSDDIVKIRKREGNSLEGFGAELTRHHMEIRGIGIINVAHLYGAVCVREYKRIDVVVQIEAWNDDHFYDRIGLEETRTDILGVSIPYLILPVKPGRDVVLLLETIALNQRLKAMGYHSARDFNEKLLELTSGKRKGKR